jgi:hypothetical protein
VPSGLNKTSQQTTAYIYLYCPQADHRVAGRLHDQGTAFRAVLCGAEICYLSFGSYTPNILRYDVICVRIFGLTEVSALKRNNPDALHTQTHLPVLYQQQSHLLTVSLFGTATKATTNLQIAFTFVEK